MLENLGVGTTNSSLIADIIDIEKDNNFKHLIIVTDGKVEVEDIENADTKMNLINYNFDFVSVYILGEEADLSIGAPYCRRIPNKTYCKRNNSESFFELNTLSKDDIMILNNLEKIIKSYNDFMYYYEKILNAFQAQCIGTSKNSILKARIESVLSKIEKNEEIIDLDLFNNRKNILIGITQGILYNTFILEGIKAAIKDYKK